MRCSENQAPLSRSSKILNARNNNTPEQGRARRDSTRRTIFSAQQENRALTTLQAHFLRDQGVG